MAYQSVAPTGAPINIFRDHAAAGFGEDLLPVLPPDAVLDPRNPNRAVLERSRGKIPGRKGANGWVGMAAWPDSRATPEDHNKWSQWNCSVGLLGRNHPAIDIDINDEALAAAIQDLAIDVLGRAPVRFGNGSRRILVYAGQGLSKMAMTVRPRSDACQGQVATVPQAVELLAAGQQYVVEGIHPKTSQPYHWLDGRNLAAVTAAGLTHVTSESVAEFFRRLSDLLDQHGWEAVRKSQGGQRRAVDQRSLLAPSLSAIRAALFSIENSLAYDEWLKMGRAVKASAGLANDAEGFAIWSEWSEEWGSNTPDNDAIKWATFRPPHEIGWDYLVRQAAELGDGSFNPAVYDFDAPGLPSADLWKDHVYIVGLDKAWDMQRRQLIDTRQFNILNRHVGSPSSKTDCAWAKWVSRTDGLQIAQSLTFRPGGELLIDENIEGLNGLCVNTWRPLHSLPVDPVCAQDVQPWLDHLAFIVPDEVERKTVLSWMAWVVQNPGVKPNWALVIGSTNEGLGKDLLLRPLLAGVGPAYVRNIGPADLDGSFNEYLCDARLLVVEEMHISRTHGSKDRLKPLLAAPPHTLNVNRKNLKQYAVPNIVALIFLTNNRNAVATSEDGRRYFVTFNDGARQDNEYYVELVNWYERGGTRLAARYLIDLPLGDFTPLGAAPATAARTAMTRATRGQLASILEEAIEDGEGPFQKQFVTTQEVSSWASEAMGTKRGADARACAVALRELNRHIYPDRIPLGRPPEGHEIPARHDAKQRTVVCLRGVSEMRELTNVEVRDLYWAERRVCDAVSQAFFSGLAS